MNMKKIVILGAGEIQIPIIKKVRELGYYSIALDYDRTAIGLQYADKYYIVSSADIDKVLEVAKKENAAALLTTSDYPVNVVATVSEMMGLISMSKEVANICTNKFLQREIFSAHGINSPKFYLVSDNNISIETYSDFPYIVKPIDSSASRGVRRVNDSNELLNAIGEAQKYSRSGQVLIEQFIGGKEFSVEALTQNNETTIVSITEKLVIGEDYGYFVEDTHIEPARVTEDEWKLIENEVLKALEVVRVNNCPSHTEVKFWNGKPYIIEMACRLGGDYITSDLVPLSTGIDMLANLVKLSIGEPIDRERVLNKVACIQFLNNQNYKECSMFIESNDPHIVKYEVKPYRNKRIENSLDRLGHIIIQCEDYYELEAILNKINAKD